MIIKTDEQLNNYIRDGGDSERISIQKEPVGALSPVGPGTGGEGRAEGKHYIGGYHVNRYNG